MRELLSLIETEHTMEPVFPADETLHGNEYGSCLSAEDKDGVHHCESAVHVATSRSRSRGFWSILRFIKETYVWLVWIPFLLIGLGIGMNLLAVTMNHGIMPVVLPGWGTIAGDDKMHVAATANSRALFLCDWIHVYAAADVASPGDYLIRAGEFLRWPLVWIWAGLNAAHLKLAGFTESFS